MSLPFAINSRLRYAGLGLHELSSRVDVRRVRERLPDVKGIGPKAISVIDWWLDEAELAAMVPASAGVQ